MSLNLGSVLLYSAFIYHTVVIDISFCRKCMWQADECLILEVFITHWCVPIFEVTSFSVYGLSFPLLKKLSSNSCVHVEIV